MTSDRLYDYEYFLRHSVILLERDANVRAQDKKLINDFLTHLRAKSVSIGRLAKYVNLLRRCAQLGRVPFIEAKREDIEYLITRVADYEIQVKKRDGTVKSTRHYSAETLADFRMAIKLFMKYIRNKNTDKKTPYPPEVDWLSTKVKPNERREPEYFTDAEAESMVREAYSLRDKALISLWHELGGRPSEILLLTVGCVVFDDYGALVHIRKGKTGSRTLRAISSVSHLRAHLETHRFKNDPEAPLWLCSSTNYLDQPLSWAGMSRMVKLTAKKAGIKKRRIHAYMFRHGSATRNSQLLTDAEMRRMYGWSMSSRMPERYIHMSGADLDRKYQEIYGKGEVKPLKPSFAPTACPRCGSGNSPGTRYCGKCATPLDETERARMVLQEQRTRDEAAELRVLLERYLKTSQSDQSQPNGQGGPS